MRHNALWSCTHIPNKYYLKNNYLTFRSKIKVPRRSLWYVTHRLMVMHPYTKYHWPTSKDKNVMAHTRKYYLIFFIWPWVQRSRSHKVNYGMRHTTLWSCTHIPNKYYLKTIIWPWVQRSRSHKGTRDTALWSCTQTPNIIDLSRKIKMLWPGQENTI